MLQQLFLSFPCIRERPGSWTDLHLSISISIWYNIKSDKSHRWISRLVDLDLLALVPHTQRTSLLLTNTPSQNELSHSRTSFGIHDYSVCAGSQLGIYEFFISSSACECVWGCVHALAHTPVAVFESSCWGVDSPWSVRMSALIVWGETGQGQRRRMRAVGEKKEEGRTDRGGNQENDQTTRTEKRGGMKEGEWVVKQEKRKKLVTKTSSGSRCYWVILFFS